MTVEGAVAIAAGVIAGSVALLGFGLDSAIEGLASVIVIWRFTGTAGSLRARRAPRAESSSRSVLPARPVYRARSDPRPDHGEHPSTSWVGIGLSVSSIVVMPLLGRAKHRIGRAHSARAPRRRGRAESPVRLHGRALLIGLAANALRAGGGLTRDRARDRRDRAPRGPRELARRGLLLPPMPALEADGCHDDCC